MPPRQFGRVQRSYLPAGAAKFVGCATCLIFPGIFLSLSGTIMTATATSDPIKTIGPIALGIGLTVILISITMCIVMGYTAKKQYDKQRVQSEQPPDAGVPRQPPPPSAYPHQQAPENFYPTAPSASTQSPDQFSPKEKQPLQSESQYPPQPANYYPDTSSYVSPSGYPPTYSESMPIHPQNAQPVTADFHPISESTKQVA